MRLLIALLLLASFSSCSKGTTSDCSASQLASNACSASLSPTRLSFGNPSGDVDDPSLIYAQDGYFYLAFLSNVSGNKEVWIARSSDGTSWSTPVQITNAADEDIYPTLLQTANGTFHLIWQRLVTATGVSHVYYRSTTNALSWGGTETAVTAGTVDDVEPMFLQAGTSDFRVFFATAERSTGLGKPAYNRDIYLVRSTDAGGTWGVPSIVSLTTPASDSSSELFPWVIKRGDSDFVLLFQQQATMNLFDATSDLMLATSSDGLTWSAATQVTSNSGDNEYDLFPNLFYAPTLGEWTISWLTTHFNATTGELANLALSSSGSYPSAAINVSARFGLSGWSTRVATPSSGSSLVVWVSSSSGTPQLYSLRVEL